MMYVKKPIPIEAVQLPPTAPTVKQYKEWIDSARWLTNYELWRTDEGFVIPTLEGDMLARWGNWIIKGPYDEIYPISNDIFVATYEPAEGYDDYASGEEA